jgi:hypothetical protein
MHDLDPRRLFIEKESVVLVTENQDIETSRIEVTEVVQLQFLTQCGARQQNGDYEDEDACNLVWCVFHGGFPRGYDGSQAMEGYAV